AVTKQAQTVPSLSPFSYLYQPLQNIFLINAPRDASGNAYTLQSYCKALAQLYLNNSTTPTGNAQVDGAVLASEAIYAALNPAFSIVTDQNAIMNAFYSLTEKTQVALTSAYFYYNSGNELFSSIQGTLFKNGLSDANLATVITFVNALPADVVNLSITTGGNNVPGTSWYDQLLNLL
ncbi:MAG: hypothetical protein ACREOZ_02605, partial [Gloeomargaritales cyanobacterium]